MAQVRLRRERAGTPRTPGAPGTDEGNADSAGTAAIADNTLVDAARHRKSTSVEVSSSSLRTWSDAEIVTGDLTTGITRLKQQPGVYPGSRRRILRTKPRGDRTHR